MAWLVLPFAASGLLGCTPQEPPPTGPTQVQFPPGGPASTAASPAETTPPSAVSSPSPSDDLLSDADLKAFARRFGDRVDLAVVGLGDREPVGRASAGEPYAWSTIKVVIVARLLRDVGGPDGLTPQQRASVRAALGASDNEAAAQLYEELERRHGGLTGAARAMGDVLRDAGDTTTKVSTEGRDSFSTYGQTRWPVTEQARFMAALERGCVLDRSSTAFLLQEMGDVIPEQRWGLGIIGAPSFKGGWGPDPDGTYRVEQMGVVGEPGQRYAVAVAARPDDGTFESGIAVLNEAVDWVSRRVTSVPEPLPCPTAPAEATS